MTPRVPPTVVAELASRFFVHVVVLPARGRRRLLGAGEGAVQGLGIAQVAMAIRTLGSDPSGPLRGEGDESQPSVTRRSTRWRPTNRPLR